jgi:HupE / UreJ protein
MHGFAFSATLTDLDLPRSNLLITLFGFNAGVELGQLAIVAVFVPLAFAARHTTAYRRWALLGGSILVALLATVWLAERALAIKLIS